MMTLSRRIRTATKRLWSRLLKKGFRYWTTACVIFLLAISGSSYVYDYLNLTKGRSQFFQQLLEWGPRPPEPGFVKIVLIEDDEYWQGDLGGRRPIKRDYLAKLVDKLVAAKVRVIALDFDIRLPDPDSMVIPQEYRSETQTLITAIGNAAKQGTKVVLATPISFDEQGGYRQDPDIYQPYGLCKRGGNIGSSASPPVPELDPATIANITCGYIALPYDPLVLPGQLRMADGGDLDSFALAVARATDPDLVARSLERIGNKVRYANYISEHKFRDSKARLSARTVLRAADKEKLEGSIVIVGAHWKMLAAGRGPRVDLHWTPAGWAVGAMLHASFAEAFLDRRIFATTPGWMLHATEIVFSLIAAAVFALIPSLGGKLAAILSLLVLLFVVQWAVLHGFGVFFDAFVPLLGLGLHSLYERLWSPEGHKRRLHVR